MSQIALARGARLLSEAVDPRVTTDTAGQRSRMVVAIGASTVVHAIVLVAAFVFVRTADVTRPLVVLPVSLVSRPGSGSGGGDAEPAPAAPLPPEIPPAVESPRAVERNAPVPAPTVVRRKPVAEPKPAAPAPPPAVASPDARGDDSSTASVPGAGDGRSEGEGGGGRGSGGFGASAASPAYGVNPQPPYPMAARRLGLEGTVVLRVVVAADGTPASVVVLQSSGHAVLDGSALETVRARWRFVPARRNGIPVEDTVQVPIRFRQTTG